MCSSRCLFISFQFVFEQSRKDGWIDLFLQKQIITLRTPSRYSCLIVNLNLSKFDLEVMVLDAVQTVVVAARSPMTMGTWCSSSSKKMKSSDNNVSDDDDGKNNNNNTCLVLVTFCK